MKKRMHSHKHLCLRQHCCGARNDQQNFLGATNRHTHSTSRMKKSDVKKTVKKKSKTKPLKIQTKAEVNKILQDSYAQMKDQNSKLIKKLSTKKKKCDQLQEKVIRYERSIENYQMQVQHFQSLLKAYEQQQSNNGKRHSKSQKENHKELQGTKQVRNSEKYHSIIEAQKNLTKETLDRYKSLEKQYEKYQNDTQRRLKHYENQIFDLEKQNEILESKFSMQKSYHHEIEGLKKQLHKIASSSTENIHNQTVKQREKSHSSDDNLRKQITQLKDKNHLLEQQLICQRSKLKEAELGFQQRENQLLGNLDRINEKVQKWEKQYKRVKREGSNEKSEWKQKYEELMSKYMAKKEKYFHKNEEWAQIFKELMVEIERLKREMNFVSERNVKLVELYAKGEQLPIQGY